MCQSKKVIYCCILLVLGCGILFSQSRSAKNQRTNSSAAENRLLAAQFKQASQLAASMDRKTLVAQVLLSAVDGRETVSEKTRQLLTEIPAGGIMLFSHNVSPDPEKSRLFIEDLYRCIAGASLPPFIASDQEGGAVQRFRGKAALPPPLSYWENVPAGMSAETALSAIEHNAVEAARELRRIGVTLNLAPVAEVLTAENRVFLVNRSYGPDAAFTARAATAFIRGMSSAGIASTLKHFPGNSATDPHRNKATLTVTAAELEKMVQSFGEVIRRESPAVVMVSHVIVPAWDTKPSSLSPVAVKRLRDMGFTGIIMADDLSMAAAGSPAEICCVDALAAGVDMIMVWPGDIRKVHEAIFTALNTGKLNEERIREAAERIIFQKLRYGLIS